MAVLSWGKPRIFVCDLDATTKKWLELPTPAEGTTQLSTAKGEKKEAKIEGGENEDVKFSKNTYTLACNIRAAKGRKRPIADNDGVITSNYAVVVQPEDKATPGFAIEKSTVSIEDTFSTDEGGMWVYNFDALKPESGNQVKWGVVTLTENAGTVSKITIAEEGGSTVTVAGIGA